MISKVMVVGVVVFGVAFAAGFLTGWKTTLRVVDNVISKKERIG